MSTHLFNYIYNHFPFRLLRHFKINICTLYNVCAVQAESAVRTESVQFRLRVCNTG